MTKKNFDDMNDTTKIDLATKRIVVGRIYDEVLTCGESMEIKIQASLRSSQIIDKADICKTFAKCSRNFYLHLGKELNSVPS